VFVSTRPFATIGDWRSQNNATTANQSAVFWLDTPIYTTARGVVYQQQRRERTTA